MGNWSRRVPGEQLRALPQELALQSPRGALSCVTQLLSPQEMISKATPLFKHQV